MMKKQSIKTVLTNMFPEYILSESDLKKLQKVLLEILKDFDSVCRKYHLKYMLCGGTLLGAIRHGGFIPWDDDVDVMMFEEDYHKVNDFIKREFPDKYTVVNEFSSLSDATTCKKIYLNNTKYVELLSENAKKPKNIFLDIFCLKSTSKYSICRKINGFFYDYAMVLSLAKIEYKYPSLILKNKLKINKKYKSFFVKRRFVGFLSNILPMKLYFMILKKILRKKHSKSHLVCIPSGIRYNREVFDKNLLSNVTETFFEGIKFYIPVEYDTYLKNLYGNYQKIPNKENQVVHVSIETDFNSSIK